MPLLLSERQKCLRRTPLPHAEGRICNRGKFFHNSGKRWEREVMYFCTVIPARLAADRQERGGVG